MREAIVLVLGMFILAGAGLMYAAIVNRRKVREMEHRERLAMIERGVMPPPESDPMRFEAAAGFVPREPASQAAVRFRTAGVLMIGFGVGLTLLIAFTAGEPAIGFGVGGAFAVLGAAALLNYVLMSGGEPRRASAPPPTLPPEPPSNIAP